MSVLLISRGSMSGGRMIAQHLGETAGFRCITREDLRAAVDQYGDIASKVTAEIETAARDYEHFSELRRPYKILMKRALLEYARQGRLAYFGYSGHLLLDKTPHFVRVRLVASTERRVRLAIQQLDYSETDARDYIRRVDTERVRWARFMYGANIRDPGLYDICVNMDRFSVPGVCDLLVGVLSQKEFQPTRESLRDVENSYIATEVLAALVNHPDTFGLELAATFEEGMLRLEGPYLEAPSLDRVLEIARTVPEVKEMHYEPGYAPAFPLLPG